MSKSAIKSIVSLLTVGMVLFFSSSSSYAAINSQSGLMVSPVITQIKLKKNQNQVKLDFKIVNKSNNSSIVFLGSKNFDSLNNQGGVSFNNVNNSNAAPHNLASDITFVSNQIILAAYQTKTVPVILNNLTTLSPGGHYVAVTFNQRASSEATGNQVQVNKTIAALLFLQTYSGGIQNLELIPPQLNFIQFSSPNNPDIIFKNLGNTQSIPRGVIKISTGNKLIYQGIINIDSSIILPGSSQLFNINLPILKAPLFFKTYTLSVAYRYAGQKNYSVYHKNFIYVGQFSIILGLILILGIILFIFWRLKKRTTLIKYKT